MIEYYYPTSWAECLLLREAGVSWGSIAHRCKIVGYGAMSERCLRAEAQECQLQAQAWKIVS